MTFQEYFNKEFLIVSRLAESLNISEEEYLQKTQKLSLSEYEESLQRRYSQKSCHSFWYKECVNRNVECETCSQYYSLHDVEYNYPIPEQKKASPLQFSIKSRSQS